MGGCLPGEWSGPGRSGPRGGVSASGAGGSGPGGVSGPGGQGVSGPGGVCLRC